MEETRQTNNNTARKRKKAAIIVFLLVAAVGAVALMLYLRYKATHITTDDAFVDADYHTIASKIPGTIKTVFVSSNQFVKKGDLLLELDAADYDVKVKEAASTFNAEKAKIAEIDARSEAAKQQLSEKKAIVDAARANLELQEANLRQAEIDIKRAKVLYEKDALSKERYERTLTGYEVAIAQVKAAKEQLKQTESSVKTQKAVIEQTESARTTQISEIKRREAQLSDAELKSGYTRLFAPADGYITKKSAETGNQIQAGQPLMAVVPLEGIYITANYKETQLEKVRPGQKVEIEVDTYPGKKFKGTVESIMAGTGSVFSLFPPENATGNFVKVVQRVPVKIVFEKDTDREHVLRVGMSVVPTILVGK